MTAELEELGKQLFINEAGRFSSDGIWVVLSVAPWMLFQGSGFWAQAFSPAALCYVGLHDAAFFTWVILSVGYFGPVRPPGRYVRGFHDSCL